MVAVGRRRDVLACLALVAAAAALGEASIFRRPDLSRTGGFLYGDPGYTLLVAREVIRGAALYADVAYQYGFLPVYLYSGIAAIFGNTPLVFLHFMLACSVVNLVLFYALVRRAASVNVALLVTLLGALPVLLLPGALLGGYVNSYYIPIERGLMIVAALAWQPPSCRTRGRAMALGCCLGALQMVRFGPGIVLGGVIVLLDAAVHASERGSWRRWVTAELWTAGAAGAMEVARDAGAFLLLPAPVARDVVWPSYILETYAAAARYPAWHGWAMGAGQYLNPLTSIVLAAVTIAWLIARRVRPIAAADASQLILPLFFATGALGLFRSEHHFYQAAWTVSSGAVIALRRWRAARIVTAVAWLPPIALVVSLPFKLPPSHMITIVVAPRWQLTMPADLAERSRAIVAAVRDSGARRVVFYPYLSGFNVALDLPLVGRESTFMHGAIRPYEEAALAHAYQAADALVTCRDARSSAVTPGLFDPDLPAAVRVSLEPRATSVLWQDAECRLVRLGPPTAR